MTKEKLDINSVADELVKRLKLESKNNEDIRNTTMFEEGDKEGCIKINCRYYKFNFNEFDHDFDKMTTEEIVDNLYNLIQEKINKNQFYNPITDTDRRYR